MSDNFDEVNGDEELDRRKKRKSRSGRSARQNYDRTKRAIDNVRRNSGRHNSSGTSAGGRSAASGGAAGGSAGTGGGAAGAGAAGSGAAGGAAGGTAAGGAAAGGGAAGGAAAGGAAAGGTAAGGALAGLAAIAWPVVLAIIIIVAIIIIILLLIGAISFFTTVPGMMMDKITEISSGLWTDFKSLFEGNAAYISEESQTALAEYIENMGYDVVGYGFASTEEIETGEDDSIKAKSKYLLAYLLADYNTYAVDNVVQGAIGSITNFWRDIFGNDRLPATGMLKFDDDHLIDITTGVKVDRDKKVVNIKVWNPELKGLNVLNTDTYTYSLDGWTGRYGKPLEFLLTLHLSTMAPDLAYHVASDKEFDTKVHIDFLDMEAYLKLQYVVNSETIEAIKSDDFEGTRLWEIEDLEYIENKIAADGSLTLSATDLEAIKDKMTTLLGDDEDVVDAIGALGMSAQSLKDAVSLCQEHGGKGKQLLSKQPYITYVEKAWYKNVYFMINDSIRNSVTDDDWLRTAPDFNAYESTDAGTVEAPPYDFHPASDSDQANIVSDTSKGVYQVLESRQSVQISQKSQPLKGSTNPRIKELFVGAGNDNIEGENPKPEYYIYDGSKKTAEAIEALQKKENEFRATGSYTEAQVSQYINSIDDDDLYRAIDFNKNSLTALAILENMQTEDADFILRDFKALLIELKYFKASDLADKKVNLLDWIVPDYMPADWPNRKYEKQNYEYGTYIKSKKSMDAIKEQEKAEGNNEENGGEENPTPTPVTNTEANTVAESGDGFPSTTKIGNASYRNYKQYQGSYATKSFWNGTMTDSGCGPTAAAIVASAYGKLEATPDKMADIIVRETTSEKVKNALATYGINSNVHSVSGNVQAAANEMRTSFNEGKPVIVLMKETSNRTRRTANLYSRGGHFIVLLGEENGTVLMSNPARGTDSGNKDPLGLEAFIEDYMTEGTGTYLIFDEAPSGAANLSVGFEVGMKVITPGIGEVTKVSGDSITIKFTETNLVKDMTMTISGFTVDSSISVGTMLDKEQEIGTTTEEDILVILRAPNKAIIENIEEYMPSPNTEEGSSAYYGDLTDDELEFFAAVLVAENGSNEDTLAAVAHVIKNRALDTEHFPDYTTIPEVLIAPGQYGSVYKVPGSGSGPTPVGIEATPPAGARTYKLEGKGEYWVGNNHRPREATDQSRQIAREVIDGTRADTVSAQLGKKALFQVTLRDYQGRADSCCVALGELYSHRWGCLVGNHESCSCTYP